MSKSKIQNTKFKTNNKFEAKNTKSYFGFWILPARRSPRPAEAFGEARVGAGGDFEFPPQGITLLLVILILAALLSISIGIFTVVFTELRISGEIADSFVALYAADEAIERGLYEDRGENPFCFPAPGPGLNCYDSGWVTLPSGACYRLRADKIEVSPDPPIYDVTLVATGEFGCDGGTFAVRRALSTSYRGGGGE